MSFGFDPTRVFGDVRKDARRAKRKKKRDDMEEMMAGSMDTGFGLGIDTFSLASPDIDPLGIGEDFGERIVRPAGQANGKGSLLDEAGFLGVIGRQQAKGVPSILGTAKKQRKIGKRAKVKRQPKSVARSPLQARTGSRFGNVDENFGKVVFTTIRGARKRIAAFREGRRVREDPPMLEFKEESVPARQARETPMLPAPPESPRSETRPREELTRGRAPT